MKRNVDIVHYDTCDLSSTFLNGVKLGPERSERPNHAVRVLLRTQVSYKIL